MNSEDEDITLPTMTASDFDKLIEVANERLSVENARLREETNALKGLIERRKRFLTRLETLLSEIQAEQETIDEEVRRLLTPEEQRVFAGIRNP